MAFKLSIKPAPMTCLDLILFCNKIKVVLATHTPINTPTAAISEIFPITEGTNNAETTLITAASFKRVPISGMLAFFHLASGPRPIKNKPGAIMATNTASKYGGPTEIFPPPSASINSGYMVPSNTEAAAAASTTLLASKKDSRDTTSNFSPKPTLGARKANNNSAPPITITKYSKINRPRLGSVANACTELSTPERTKKVPSKLNENAQMDSNTVHTLNAPRFSVTANECINAVPTSQGINEAFSTASQNHQPPQPNS